MMGRLAVFTQRIMHVHSMREPPTLAPIYNKAGKKRLFIGLDKVLRPGIIFEELKYYIHVYMCSLRSKSKCI